MAVEHAVGAITSITANDTLDIQPAGADEYVVHNISYAGAVEIYFTDGTNSIERDSDSAAGGKDNLSWHCTNALFYSIKNVSGGTMYISWDGVQSQ